MTPNRYRAGQPADLSHMLHRAMPIDFAGDEPKVEQEPVKEHKPEPGLIAGFLKLIGGKWKCE